MLRVVAKPMTLNLPALHDDNDDLAMSVYGGMRQVTTSWGHPSSTVGRDFRDF